MKQAIVILHGTAKGRQCPLFSQNDYWALDGRTETRSVAVLHHIANQRRVLRFLE